MASLRRSCEHLDAGNTADGLGFGTAAASLALIGWPFELNFKDCGACCRLARLVAKKSLFTERCNQFDWAKLGSKTGWLAAGPVACSTCPCLEDCSVGLPFSQILLIIT